MTKSKKEYDLHKTKNIHFQKLPGFLISANIMHYPFTWHINVTIEHFKSYPVSCYFIPVYNIGTLSYHSDAL